MRRTRIASRSATFALAVCVASATVAAAQTRIRPGFNLFSAEQDVEIGRQSAAEVERQLPLLRDRAAQQYVQAIGRRLAAAATGPKFPYQFKVINASEVNAFALPGGFMYVNRGLVEAAGAEGQLAGVMAHEMAHVSLRHGTNQASKAHLGQAGLGLLGGILGKDDRSAQKTIDRVGGFGLNAMFLKFSRTAEEQADVVGAQILARAGYDPMDMVNFFEVLRGERNREPGKVEQFLSSHPSPGNRAARVRRETDLLDIRPTRPIGGFLEVKSRLSGMPPAPTSQDLARRQANRFLDDGVRDDGTIVEYSGDKLLPGYRVFEQSSKLYRIQYPDGWRVHEPSHGFGVVLAPWDGLVDTGGRDKSVIHGVIINHYDPFNDDVGDSFADGSPCIAGDSSLVLAANDLIAQILSAQAHLRMVLGSERRQTVDGAAAVSVLLSGRSPATKQNELVTVFARGLPDDHVIYALFVAPEKEYEESRPAFDRMISSLSVRDEAAH